MSQVWVHRTINASAEALWVLLSEPERWPEWGPSVRRAELDGGALETGATGTVHTVLGVKLPFEITDHEPNERWSWKVAGVPATGHRVEPRGPGRCRVSFGVPIWAAPYAVVCRAALHRLDAIATRETQS